MRRLLLLACFVAAGTIFSASSWAGAEGPEAGAGGGNAGAAIAPATPQRKEETVLTHLKGIREVLGGHFLLAFFIPWAAAGGVGLLLLAAGLSPARVAAAERALRRGRWQVIVIGAASVVILVVVAKALGEAAKRGAPALGVASLASLGVLVWLAVYGLAAMAKLIGQRLLRDEQGVQSPWRLVGVGGLAIAGTLLVPLFGWAAFIYLFCRGVGAATLALFSAPGPEPPAHSPVPTDRKEPTPPGGGAAAQ
jgi:hypothetical protein